MGIQCKTPLSDLKFLVGVLVVVVVIVAVLLVTGGKQSQLLVPRLKSGLWTLDWSLTINQLVLTSVQLILLIMNFLREC